MHNSILIDLSADGRTLLFGELGSQAGLFGYLRNSDGSPAIQLGAGFPLSLSPDGKWVLSNRLGPTPELLLIPTRAGESRSLPNDTIKEYFSASWFPDGKRLAFAANEAGRPPRLYVQDVPQGKPRPITPEGVAGKCAISPDGRLAAIAPPGQTIALYPVDGGQPRQIPGAAAGDTPIRWSTDGRTLYVHNKQEFPIQVFRVDVASGRREFWMKIMPPDPAGLDRSFLSILITPDGKSYAYNYFRLISELYLVEGLK